MKPRTRCLLLRPGALGDVILTLPAFSLLRREFSELELVLAASPAGRRVGELCGLFDAAVPYESQELAGLFADGVEREGLLEDVAALVAFGAGGADGTVERALDAGVPLAADVDTWPQPGGGHVAEQLLRRAAEALEVDLSAEPLLVPGQRAPGARDFSRPEGAPALPPPQVAPDPAPWRDRPGLRLAVAPGAGSPAKCWPAELFAETCRLLAARRGPLNLILVLGPAEMDRPEFRAAFASQPCTVSECWSVRDLAALFAGCDLYLGNDSGVSHLAAWAGARGLTVFGPTDPDLWAPLGDVRAVRMERLAPRELAEAAGETLLGPARGQG